MLHEFVANLTARQPQLFGGALTPETFALPEQRAALERRLAARGAVDAAGWPNWLSKAKTHRGVRALRSADASSLAALGQALVQERVRPLLLPSLRRAFDIGLYVVVSSVRPLRVYAHDVALVRFCEAEYPQTPAQFAEASRFVVKEYTPIWDLRATFGADLARCGGAAACALRRRLQAEGWDADALWRRMERAAAALLAELRPAVEARLRAQRLRSDIVFELFRFDFLVDERARPVLTEVNISPNMVGRVPEDSAAKERLLRDTLRLALARLDPHPPAGGARGSAAAAPPAAARSRRRATRAAAAASPPRRRARSRRRRPRRRSTAGAASRRRPTTTSRRRCGARRRGATPSCAACCAEGHRFSLRIFGRASSIVCVRLVSARLGHLGRLSARAPERQCAASSHERKADTEPVDAVEHRHLRRALGVAARRARAAPDLSSSAASAYGGARRVQPSESERRRHRARPSRCCSRSHLRRLRRLREFGAPIIAFVKRSVEAQIRQPSSSDHPQI